MPGYLEPPAFQKTLDQYTAELPVCKNQDYIQISAIFRLKPLAARYKIHDTLFRAVCPLGLRHTADLFHIAGGQ